jgi:hypothetical protein
VTTSLPTGWVRQTAVDDGAPAACGSLSLMADEAAGRCDSKRARTASGVRSAATAMQVMVQSGLAYHVHAPFTLPWPSDAPTHATPSQSTTAGEGALFGHGHLEGVAGALVRIQGQAAMHRRSTVPGEA